MDTGYNTIMDTVYEKYGPYIKLTWGDIGCNQQQGCLKFEVFAHIEGNNITAHYSDGEKLEDPRLVYDEKLGWKLFFTKYDHVNKCEQETFEFVDEIEKSNKEKFEKAASSNKENRKNFKF